MMDRKTLEYMEERAEKARKIVKHIDELTKSVEIIYGTDGIKGNGVKFFSNSTSVILYGCELVKEIQKHAIEAINHEVTRLEKELAEL